MTKSPELLGHCDSYHWRTDLDCGEVYVGCNYDNNQLLVNSLKYPYRL